MASCGAVEAFARALAVDLAPIRVNVIQPGFEIADAVLFLMKNSYVTGITLTVDGGGLLV